MPVAVRAAVPGDGPILDVIRKQAMEDGFSGQYPRSVYADLVAAPGDDLREWIASEEIQVTVVETDVTPVSFGVLDTRTGRILALYTAPDYQHEGFATRVLARLADRARTEGLAVITVHAPVNAVGFFERCQFHSQPTDEPPQEPPGLRVVRMTRAVT